MVKRLRRRPLTAETGVRFPMGLPKKHTTISSCVFCFTADRVFHIALQAVILARRGVVIFIARKPLFLHGGERCFLLRASRYSCMAGRGVFLLHASRGAFCMARCVVVIERQIEFFTASCTFFIGILHCTASLAFFYGRTPACAKFLRRRVFFCDDPAIKRSNRKKHAPFRQDTSRILFQSEKQFD